MEEEFMAPIKKVVGAGKLRVSWGLTGNNRIGEYDYYALLQMLKENREIIFPTEVYQVAFIL